MAELNIVAQREKTTPSGKHVVIYVTEPHEIFKRGIYVTVEGVGGGKKLSASLTSVESVKNIKLDGAWRTGDMGTLALRTEHGCITLTGEEAAWLRVTAKRPVRRFLSETDQETGITWHIPYGRISPAQWEKVSHLFQRDVELDCPEGRAWNDSITLKYATRQPEKVAQILGWEYEDEK